MTTAIVIFALTYVAIAGARIPFVRLDRPAAALCGAIAMVAFGVLDVETALGSIDLHVVTLLLGVMVIAAYLTEAHFFRYIAWMVVTRTRSARTLLWALVFVSGGLSALLVNDTICLMFTPLVVAVTLEARLPPFPYLLALASATNIGGVVTFTGNPQNMIIGQAAAGDPTYLEYLLRSLPLGIACLAIDALLIGWMFRHSLPHAPLAERHPPKPYLDKRLAAKCGIAMAVFVGLAMSNHSLAGSAMTGAAFLILTARRSPKAALAGLDWTLLLFFAALFVVVTGVAHSGALDAALDHIMPHLGEAGPRRDAVLMATTAIGSNLVSNVPFVLVAVHWVPSLPEPGSVYTMLAVASTFAGNLTLFGSMANIIVLESAGPPGEVGFWRFARYGAVITVATMAVAYAYLSIVP